ncbi:MAG: hypothetical protein ACTFAL_04060 [Candidatus Electronema sp. V4]|uniref:hypothetical protein n=1 Tax=Candidatus Electronema sp. V4 TaxID=3454756 RepID=UPI0040557F2B
MKLDMFACSGSFAASWLPPAASACCNTMKPARNSPAAAEQIAFFAFRIFFLLCTETEWGNMLRWRMFYKAAAGKSTALSYRTD